MELEFLCTYISTHVFCTQQLFHCIMFGNQTNITYGYHVERGNRFSGQLKLLSLNQLQGFQRVVGTASNL